MTGLDKCIFCGMMIAFAIIGSIPVFGPMIRETFQSRCNNAGDVRRKRKWIFRSRTFNGVTKSWCRAIMVQMRSAGGTLTGYDYAPPRWIDVGWGEFIESVGHTQPKVNLFMPTCATAEPIINMKDNEGAAIVWSERRTRRPLRSILVR